jgi:pyruvate kinase
VRRAADVAAVRALLTEARADIRIIAKLEKPQALDNLDEILEVSDGVMVARGDLGVELAPERVPIVQKQIISRANERGLLVITATQMLESMISNPRPTRAEASDVANAILDGSDAVMLSAETSVGAYPTEAVRMMASIATDVEASELYRKFSEAGATPRAAGLAYTISRAVDQASHDLNANGPPC